MMYANDSFANGFSSALVIPAVASTLRQAQREAADDLHTLARFYQSHRQRGGTSEALPLRLDERTQVAARSFGKVLAEQVINGTTYFLGVKLAIMTAGAFGGLAAQLAITGNTMITPLQTQRLNPARRLFDAVGMDPDWAVHMSDATLVRFAYSAGMCADFCAYGEPARTVDGEGNGNFRIRFEPGPRQSACHRGIPAQ
jgi:hypothetical protein